MKRQEVFVHKLGLTDFKAWKKYASSDKRPDNIPYGPEKVYKDNGWIGLGDWLGTGRGTYLTKRSDEKILPFEEAREYVRKLGLGGFTEWISYCKSGKRPTNIPASPYTAYKDKGWKGFGDWTGSGKTRAVKLRPFQQAREYARSLGLHVQRQWTEYCQSGKRPPDIPANPDDSYREEWQGWSDWFGTKGIVQFKPFEEAREYVRNLQLGGQSGWIKYVKSQMKPDDIPSTPNIVYKDKGWKGYGDWTGTGRTRGVSSSYLPFEEAREYVRSLKLKRQEEWFSYCKSGNRPSNIPSVPHKSYSENWEGYANWLGIDSKREYKKHTSEKSILAPSQKFNFLPFEEAREYMRSLNLKSVKDWKKYINSSNRHLHIPKQPQSFYKDKWMGYKNWLGIEEKVFLPFEQARDYIRSLQLGGQIQWFAYTKSGKKPDNIPSTPNIVYKDKGWKGFGDWTGTERVRPNSESFRTFEEAREYARSLGLDGQEQWKQFVKSEKKPKDIPTVPEKFYQEKWINWYDWLGKEDTSWSVNRVKELLQDLIKSRTIYQWSEAVLYSLLLRKGLLNLGNTNRHYEFFKNLLKASRTQQGRKMIEDYAYSDTETPPDISYITDKDGDTSEEIQTISTSDLANVIKSGDPLDYEDNSSVEQILSHTLTLESISVDEEAMQFYLDYSVDELWRCAFKNEYEAVRNVKFVGKNGNKYHDMVIDTFLKDYEGSKSLKIPTGYSFPYPPTLMQRYVAYKVTSLPYFGNFSGTGAGKTLSAILASRIIDSKLTVIVCPNDVVEQWKRNILETFPNSKVITGKDAFYIQRSNIDYQYAVLNYDKFSQEESPNLVLNLSKQKVDFVILDEVHFTKIRNEDEISQRRRNLDGLMTGIRRINPNVKVLGLSATPVVNNLREGRSLLELISGKIYDDVAVRPTIPNAVTLYEKLTTISIRELPTYSVDVDTHNIDVISQKPTDISVRQLKTNPLAIEKFLTDARIPEIVKLIDGQTIIYTEYVEDIIQNLSTAVQNAGYSYALYTGFDRSGLTRFLSKNVQVLIASRPLSVGVDGLQHICNRLIINTLPWTNAQYQQLIGRLVRKGQIRDVVQVYIVKASIGGYQYDDLKWKRIQFKRTLADCAVDGRLPEKNLVTPQQAAMEAVKWLERLERGEVSTIVRRELNVELQPVEIKRRVIKYGDFTKLNNKINSENSETTHYRILKDPEEWDEYHRQYREARKSWPIIPFDEIIRRISQLSPRLLIGDFGCGEAKILEKFGAERVSSFDHVAINNKVTACDIKSVPLPDEAIDIAVFSLSLMGRNWPDYIKEAKRCLATNGYLLIAETTKSMKGRLSKLKETIEQQGFDIYNEEEKGDFTFIEAREL